MEKRGQISLFLILAVSLVAIAGLFIYFNGISSKNPNVETPIASADVDTVKSYAETCIKKIAEEALYTKIGKQGGYINPKGQPNVDNGKSKYNSNPVTYHGSDVPFYIEKETLTGSPQFYTYIPSLDSINIKLGNYLQSEFHNCFDIGIFKDTGIDVTEQEGKKIKFSVNSNSDDVSIVLNYPLLIKKGTVISNLNSFAIYLPIRLKLNQESASNLVESIKAIQPNAYDISSNCYFDSRHLTNVFLENIPNGKIIRFVDYSSYNPKYPSFTFQFAVKDVNIVGECIG